MLSIHYEKWNLRESPTLLRWLFHLSNGKLIHKRIVIIITPLSKWNREKFMRNGTNQSDKMEISGVSLICCRHS